MCLGFIGLHPDYANDPRNAIIFAEGSFDIIELAYPSLLERIGKKYNPPRIDYGTDPRKPTVAFEGKAYYTHAVNYAMYGKMVKLCAKFMKDDIGYSLTLAEVIATGRKARNSSGVDVPGTPNVDQAIAFTRYGHNGASPAGTALNNLYVNPNKISKQTTGFNWVWEPGKHRQLKYPGME